MRNGRVWEEGIPFGLNPLVTNCGLDLMGPELKFVQMPIVQTFLHKVVLIPKAFSSESDTL